LGVFTCGSTPGLCLQHSYRLAYVFYKWKQCGILNNTAYGKCGLWDIYFLRFWRFSDVLGQDEENIGVIDNPSGYKKSDFHGEDYDRIAGGSDWICAYGRDNNGSIEPDRVIVNESCGAGLRPVCGNMATDIFVLRCDLLHRLAGRMDVEQDYAYARSIAIEYDFNRGCWDKGIRGRCVFDIDSVYCLLFVSCLA